MIRPTFLLLLLALSGRATGEGPAEPCSGPQRCVPDFENAAFGRTATACDASGCHPAPELTDLHDAGHATCWAPDAPFNVTLPLDKAHELTYVSVQFCASLPPDASLAVHKSSDGGRTWIPFHLWSAHCRRATVRTLEAPPPSGALCRAPPLGGDRLAFGVLEGRPSQLDASPLLQDWVSVTHVRISAPRLLPPLADLSVGGRCKCNGHAHRCSGDAGGRLRCECGHNTAGRDCERCRPFHFDRPWGRATEGRNHECVACRCHGHSRRCRFSMELFRLSGGESGGVCQGCRHNTAGRHCHYCREGYYRDAAKSMQHRRACRACDCHPVGSSGLTCNQTSGQCPCKEGVAGLTCNRCARGYYQSRSTAAPCIRVFRSDPSDVEDLGTAGECGRCPAAKKRLNLKKYCRKDYAIQADVVSRESVGDWVRFGVHVRHVFKAGPVHLRTGPQSLWVRGSDAACGCPRIRTRHSYLVLGSNAAEGARYSGLHAHRDSLVVEWREDWPWRMRRFQRRQRNGRCGR